MNEKLRIYRLVLCMALVLTWGMMYPRMAFVEGVCRVVDENGRTLSGNCTVSDNGGILNCTGDQIRIRFWFQDLNN